jgi:spore germination cell wall hydrolase CwlJ-like protein
MDLPRRCRHRAASALLSIGAGLVSAGLGGCASTPQAELGQSEAPKPIASADKDCLVRAMYFESNRSSGEGLLAIGSVVMNRVGSGIYPGTICGVVGQRGQFVAGILSLPMVKRDKERVERIADEVLAGKRHPKIANAMYFHMAGLHFHYPNMHYVLVAGGNAFYERKRRERHDSSLSRGGPSPLEPDDFTEGNRFALGMSPLTPGATASSLVQPH